MSPYSAMVIRLIFRLVTTYSIRSAGPTAKYSLPAQSFSLLFTRVPPHSQTNLTAVATGGHLLRKSGPGDNPQTSQLSSKPSRHTHPLLYHSPVLSGPLRRFVRRK
jgi:hypothetical protein